MGTLRRGAVRSHAQRRAILPMKTFATGRGSCSPCVDQHVPSIALLAFLIFPLSLMIQLVYVAYGPFVGYLCGIVGASLAS